MELSELYDCMWKREKKTINWESLGELTMFRRSESFLLSYILISHRYLYITNITNSTNRKLTFARTTNRLLLKQLLTVLANLDKTYTHPLANSWDRMGGPWVWLCNTEKSSREEFLLKCPFVFSLEGKWWTSWPCWTLSWTKSRTRDPIRNVWFWNVRLDWQLGALHWDYNNKSQFDTACYFFEDHDAKLALTKMQSRGQFTVINIRAQITITRCSDVKSRRFSEGKPKKRCH